MKPSDAPTEISQLRNPDLDFFIKTAIYYELLRSRSRRRARPLEWPPTPTWRTTGPWRRWTASPIQRTGWSWGRGRKVSPSGSKVSRGKTAAGWTLTGPSPGKISASLSAGQTLWRPSRPGRLRRRRRSAARWVLSWVLYFIIYIAFNSAAGQSWQC